MTHSILIIGRGVPYPISVGADAARFGLLSALARSFNVTLLAVDEGAQAEQGAAALRRICKEVVLVPPAPAIRRGPAGFLMRNAKLLFRGEPRELQAEGSGQIGPALERLTSQKQFDLAHFHYWTTAQYRRFANCPAVLLNFDAWFETIAGYAQHSPSPLARLSWMLEGWATKRRELAAQRAFDWSLFFTEEDRKAMSDALGGLPRSALLPLACPFDPVDAEALAGPREPLVLFTGALGAPFNIDAVTYFVHEIWPHVKATAPDARLVITGKEAHERVIAAGRAPGVTVAGWVDDLDDLFRRSAVFVAPMRIGTGVKVKVAHAMSRGLPVVGTRRAFRGLPDVEGLIAADEPQAFAHRIVELLVTPERRQALGLSALRVYRERLWLDAMWPEVVRLYKRILDDVDRPAG